MVHGKFFGSFHLVAPVATNSCGTFLVFMYFWIAEFGGVPSELKTNSTSSLSTSLRACSTVFGGLIGVVIADEVDLAAVDAAVVVDLLEIGGFGLADHAVGGGRSAVGHDVADLDFGVGGAGVVFLLREALPPERGEQSQTQPRAIASLLIPRDIPISLFDLSNMSSVPLIGALLATRSAYYLAGRAQQQKAPAAVPQGLLL